MKETKHKLDFISIRHRKKGEFTYVYPEFLVKKPTTLMVRGKAFYAVWDIEIGLWSTSEYRCREIIDSMLWDYKTKLETEGHKREIVVMAMVNFSNDMWAKFQAYIKKLPESFKQLDKKVTFEDTVIKKTDYVSKRLPYKMKPAPTPSFDVLLNTLYDEENTRKIKWAIGSVINGDSKKIQKFYVFFGNPGTGKSTILNIIQMLFSDYCSSFNSKKLTSGNGGFPVEAFRDNNLVTIDHEGDLSRVSDNSYINSIVSHDRIQMNIKYQSSFSMKTISTLFIATNKPVNITDSKSGLIRRLIDIRPTGEVLPPEKYHSLIESVKYELGGIAQSCLDCYENLGKNFYTSYKPVDMILRTNVFYNFVSNSYYTFQHEDVVSLSQAWKMYKEFVDSYNIKHSMSRHIFRDELKSYWRVFKTVDRIGKHQVRSVYRGFRTEMFGESALESNEVVSSWLDMAAGDSTLDNILSAQPAQRAGRGGTPLYYWKDVTTTLSDINPEILHFVIPPENHIVVDFDIKGPDGEKSLELNKLAASKLPPTYAEVSKSGNGLHLHYEYTGDVSKLSRVFDVDIEVLIPSGNSSIRRMRSNHNNYPVAIISSGLPKKEIKRMTSGQNKIENERHLRVLIARNLKKEYHPNTTPSLMFIETLVRRLHESGTPYDISDLEPIIAHFASESTNQAEKCMEIAYSIPYQSNESVETANREKTAAYSKTVVEKPIAFFDLEVFKNINMLCWMLDKEGAKTRRLINPTPEQIESLVKETRLIGYNNRRYDNHILHAMMLGMTPIEIYGISKRIVDGDRSAYFRDAYNHSYADVYEYVSKKQSLKAWQLELGITHKELDHPWDEPLPEEKVNEALGYCDNDVISLRKVFHHRYGDFLARMILARLSGRNINDSTISITASMMFGRDKHYKKEFEYTDLSEMFPGYEYYPHIPKTQYKMIEAPESGELIETGEVVYIHPVAERFPSLSGKRKVSIYKGEKIGEGGYNWSKPGIYPNVWYKDITSMHPNSMVNLNLFGKYTQRLVDIIAARVGIKHGDSGPALRIFGDAIAEFLDDDRYYRAIDLALKLFINQLYGYTSASFDNPFSDKRNVDNIVAKRGALFMCLFRHYLIDIGVEAVHFKTDSVKMVNPTQEQLDLAYEFGREYGYDFGLEGIFDRMVIINDADLIGQWSMDHPKHPGEWEPVGKRFKEPYVLKKLFTKEPLTIEDYKQKRSVRKGSLYLKAGGVNRYIGRAGTFVAVKEGYGGTLLRVDGEKEHAVADTKGYNWLEFDVVKNLNSNLDQLIDETYYMKKVDEVIEIITALGDPNFILP